MTAASAAAALSPNVASTPRIERDIGGSDTDEESLQSFLDDLSDDVEAEMNSNDDGNLSEYDLEHAAYRTVDLLLPEKEPLTLKVLPVVITVAAISSAFFGAMAFIIGARDQSLLCWVALGAVFTLGVFLNARTGHFTFSIEPGGICACAFRLKSAG